MNRSEHLAWCKDRANEIIKSGDTQGGFASFMSDMSKLLEKSKNDKYNQHEVNIYCYNPDNFEVKYIRKYKIMYAPTKKWNVYNILVNGYYTGVDIQITLLNQGNPISARKLVGLAMSNYHNKDNRIRVRLKGHVTPPNKQCEKLLKHNFEAKLKNMGDFKNRDELTKMNLILQ